ncbi:helix-turn-helix transcriptional regulator [Pelagibius sp.]|uniref:helix-turn-helix transcriptional regulator n=1 Tax=Pelagibius sp. TaxID=1931238 RepID=UPI0026158E89|nr:helix-turn-helix transcriptional regulator [Pelagibius sp.]
MAGKPSLIETVSCIYRSALEPEGHWTEALDRIAAIMGAAGSHIHVVDPHREEVSVSGMSSLFPDLGSDVWTTWRERYVKFDMPAYRALMETRSTGFHADFELLGLTSEAQHRVFPSIRFNIEQFGIRHRAGTRLNLHDGWLDVLAVLFADARGPMTADEAAIGESIIPHMAKSVEMQRNFVVLRKRHDAVVAALDRWHVGICITRGDGSVVMTNRHADGMLESRDGLGLDRSGRLVVLDGEHNGALSAAVLGASRTAVGSSDDAETLMAIKRLSGQDAYLISVSPLCDVGYELEPGFAGALVAIIDPTDAASISTAGMGEIYRLTATEQEVCRLLAEGWKTHDIAELRSLQLETVRSYVKSILAKTRTHNRANLVRLAMLLNPPIEERESQP